MEGIKTTATAQGGKTHKESKWKIIKGVKATADDVALGYTAGLVYTLFVATKEFSSKSGTSYVAGDWFAILEE